MDMSAHPRRGLSRKGRAVTICVLLLCTAALKMVWTWTGDAAFLLASAVPVLTVTLLCLWGRGQVPFEVVGGPWDGARVPMNTVDPDAEVLVLPTSGGKGARYAVADHRSLVYQGQTQTPD